MKIILPIIISLSLMSCASFHTQLGLQDSSMHSDDRTEDPLYSIYLIGDAGRLNDKGVNNVAKAVEVKLQKEEENSALIYLGDNIYPNGFPAKGHKQRKEAEKILDAQINIAKQYKGKTIFIPGNHDLRKGLKGIKREEKYIEKALKNDHIFFPENGCPLQKIKVNDDIVIITINSEWYLGNWDKTPTINDHCEIKTRARFFDELEGLIKKSEGKTTVIALHHPIYTNGAHGGYFSARQHLKPAPALGSLACYLRKLGGVTPQDVQNKRYLEFRQRIISLTRYNSKIIFVAGHEHNLQYIKKNTVTQIVSGSGANKTAIKRNVNGFAYPDYGYVKINIYDDGSSEAKFFGVSENSDTLVFQTEIIAADKEKETMDYIGDFPKFENNAIYSEEETNKSKLYEKLWGERYRKYYSTMVKAKTVNLDTLFGGLTPKRKGGGHQSVSLILKTQEGKEYVMRAMRKSATKYIQTSGFKNHNIENDFDDTATEKLILDVFTASHPYAPYTISAMSAPLGIYHTNATLYYVPKQKALKGYNDEYGNSLYMIEERATSGHGDQASFGYSDKIISTDDMLKQLRKNGKHSVDQASYIRARLFDMVIGDWDRHQDQWRWAQFKREDGKHFFRPVPRDRDQAFSVMGDGFVLGIATKMIPQLRLLEAFDNRMKSPKWFNFEPYPLDMALINGTDKNLWDEQVEFIKNNLTETVIDEAFTHFPDEMKDETIQQIKQKLLNRIDDLQRVSDIYYHIIHKTIVIKGTDENDYFEIVRLQDGETQVKASRNSKNGNVYFNAIFNHKITKEILIYGLDGRDHFEVTSDGNDLISVKLVGGQENDVYEIVRGKKIMITDFKSKNNTFVSSKGRHRLTDNYRNNVYDYHNATYDYNQIVPTLGYNKDDGISIGLIDSYNNNSMDQSKFVEKQILVAKYFTNTNGFEFKYRGEYNNVLGSFKLHTDAVFTSPNYSLNFYGFGNETTNAEDDLDKYNRVRLKTIAFAPSLVRKGVSGSVIKFALRYEVLNTEKTPDRFIEVVSYDNIIPDYVFVNQNYVGVDFTYSYENRDSEIFPTVGLNTSLKVGYKNNLSNNKSFSYLVPVFGFDYKLNKKGSVVLDTKLKAHINLKDDFEFYHAASIGASDGLRGFRNQRFTGKNSFYQNVDIRYKFNKIKTGLMPVNIGVFTGFDYGRVWLNADSSNMWHTSIGGGVIIDMADLISFEFGVFNSVENTLFSFGLHVGL